MLLSEYLKLNLRHEQFNMSAHVNSKPHDQSCFVQDLLRFLPPFLHSSSVNKSSSICVKSSKQPWRLDVTLTMYWTENHPVSPFRAFLWCPICRRHVWMQMQATRGDKILTIHDSTRFSHSNSFFSTDGYASIWQSHLEAVNKQIMDLGPDNGN